MIVTLVVLVLLVALLFYGVMIYNNLVNLKHAISQAWANIDVLLKQRHDELPKLVEVCKQSMHFEQETLERVVRARSQVQEAREAGDVRSLGRAEGAMRSGLGALFAVAEAYPDLKTNETFQHLQARISGLEESIADRREFYNAAVNANNVRIEQFPDVIVARLLAFGPAELFKVASGERADVDLKGLFAAS
ncbi:MAG: LemA family protein [Thiomonas arsenitoxydans]|uniref:LemA family protein n=1 Tax=Thiomonas arsenitoxydans (strain DSM 22701 / CIP 110005 / 3As) TaxID=426114 RepID=A0A8I1MWS0_THIA3|nr:MULTISPECIES: LemA family protein [Thiomonas]MBN8744372.1 LemA family protein [Thiomonas arsenitoxydans]ODU96663.1 MAG: LemA family protein [Thiomonas sp. SCN 64-16]